MPRSPGHSGRSGDSSCHLAHACGLLHHLHSLQQLRAGAEAPSGLQGLPSHVCSLPAPPLASLAALVVLFKDSGDSTRWHEAEGTCPRVTPLSWPCVMSSGDTRHQQQLQRLPLRSEPACLPLQGGCALPPTCLALPLPHHCQV